MFEKLLKSACCCEAGEGESLCLCVGLLWKKISVFEFIAPHCCAWSNCRSSQKASHDCILGTNRKKQRREEMWLREWFSAFAGQLLQLACCLLMFIRDFVSFSSAMVRWGFLDASFSLCQVAFKRYSVLKDKIWSLLDNLNIFFYMGNKEGWPIWPTGSQEEAEFQSISQIANVCNCNLKDRGWFIKVQYEWTVTEMCHRWKALDAVLVLVCVSLSWFY